MSSSRSIPEPTKRLLRREAGFGCCVCGTPIFEYHHVRAFSDVAEHDATKMMVLCPNHHHQATVGALAQSDQERWKAEPFNISNGYVGGQLIITDPCLAVELASNQFVGEGVKIVVDDVPLLQLHREAEGGVSISLDLFDSEGALLAAIDRNEWISGDPLPWDLEFGYRWLRIRLRKGDPVLFIDARRRPIEMVASLWRNGQHFRVRGDLLEFNGVAKSISLANLALVGLMLAVDTTARTFAIKPDPSFGAGTLVSWPDVQTRLELAFEAHEKLKHGGK